MIVDVSVVMEMYCWIVCVYILMFVQVRNKRNYYLHTCGLLYSVITFYVVPSTIITPMNSTITVITEGDTTTITCEAIGYPPPTTEWSRTNGTLSDRVSVSDSVSAPTGNGNVTSVSVNLTLINANREDTGLYECSASNSVGSDNRNISVTVQCELIVIRIFEVVVICILFI